MLRRLLLALGALLVVAFAGTAYLFFRFLHTDTVKVDDRLYVVLGGGGNTAILIGDDGVLVVDTKFARPGHELAGIVESVTPKPVKVIVNTHYHFEHTHGNVNFGSATDVIAQRRTRQHMINLDARFWEFEPGWSMLPGDLVDDHKELRFGDETVRIVHPGRGHTDGDVVVHFVNRGIVHTGDLFVRDLYPYIDLEAGGSGVSWPQTLDAVLALTGVTQYIPGHGPVSSRADLERFQRYLRSLVSQVQDGAASGKSLQEVQATVNLREFADFVGVPFVTTQRSNVQWVYEELTKKKK